MHIVVVEDDDSIGQIIHDVLVDHGYHVEWCTSGKAASAALSEAAPDLVLLDAGLPDVDGFTLCRWLRERHPALPIVVVTARDSEIDTVVGLDAGATDYVTKPFSMNVLLARIRAHLRAATAGGAEAPISVGPLR